MLVTEEVGNRVKINGAVLEVVTCQLAAGILQYLLKRDPRIRQPPLTPGCDFTRPAFRSTPRMRRITTGFVFTLPAMNSDVNGWGCWAASKHNT